MSAPGQLTLRVTVGDAWLPVQVTAEPGESVAAVKARALAEAMHGTREHGAFEVKYGGARVRDEGRTLGELGVPDGAALVVLSRRRRAVR